MDKEKDYVEGAEIQVSGVSVNTNPRDPEEIFRVVIEFNEGKQVTWKPKIKKEEFKDGIKIVNTVPMKLSELPSKLKQIGKIVNMKGFCKVKASYNVWNTEKDGNPITYRFVQGLNPFDKWEVLSQETPKNPEESVV